MLDNVKIKSMRNSLGLTAQQVGERIGVSYSMILHIERGFKIPNADVLKRLADCLGCKTDELYKSEES